MKRYNVTGMSCAACSARVEKAVSNVDGVTSCSVNLLSNYMTVEGTASDSDIIAAVTSAGYGASLDGETAVKTHSKTEHSEAQFVLARLISSAVLLIILMYFSMGHHMLNLPVPVFLEGNMLANGLLQLILSASVLVINQKFFINGFKGVIHGAPNMDTLVAVGAGAAFVYSTWVLFEMTAGASAVSGFYFESAAMIVTLVTVGKLLESRSKSKASNAVKDLMKLTPDTAVIIVDGVEKTVLAKQIRVNDIFIVKAGSAVPADGVIIEGVASLNESALTGESIPVDKQTGESVSAGTVNMSGYVICRATAVGENTGLARIIQTVNDAAATKAPIARVADRIAGVFVPVVMAIALVTVIVWLIIGKDVGFALARGISVLVISCPCALGLATPVAVTVAGGRAAKSGILFKSAAAMEEMGRVKIIALDKTGTVTQGTPGVTDIIPAESVTEEELLTLASSLEKLSEHPLSTAITRKAEEMGITFTDVTDFITLTGKGVSGKINGAELRGGNITYISENCVLPDAVLKQAEELAKQGKTPLYFSRDGVYLGLIAVADTIREDSRDAIKRLKDAGVRTVLLTGDNELTAKAVADKVNIDEVIAGVRPEGKSEVIERLKKENKTAMVGDGINDAPALTSADIGVAIGAGTDIAIDCADVVLINSRLSDAADAVMISRKALRNIRQNLFWAFFYNALCIPLAAGVFIPLGLQLEPMFGAAAMSLSSVCVVTNALRLNRIKTGSAKERKKIMKITLKIEGMMCPHCENRVKQTLEGIEGVESAVVSHKSGTAEVTASAEISADTLKAAVEAQGYKVI